MDWKAEFAHALVIGFIILGIISFTWIIANYDYRGLSSSSRQDKDIKTQVVCK